MPRRRKTQGAKVPSGAVPYGQGEALAAAQRQMPLPGPGATPQPSRSPVPARGPVAPATGQAAGVAGDPMAAAVAAAAATLPPDPGRSLTRPSERPGEPVTTGLAIGPGAGPEVLPVPPFSDEDDVLLDLTNAYRMAPSEGLRRLIELARARAVARQRTLAAGRAVRR